MSKRVIREFSKAEILQRTKARSMGFYQKLTQEQQQQFCDFPQQLEKMKTTREIIQLTKPIYLMMEQNQA